MSLAMAPAPDTSPLAPPTADPAGRPMAGVIWMVVTGLCFVAVTASVKMVGTEVPAAQSAFSALCAGSGVPDPDVARGARGDAGPVDMGSVRAARGSVTRWR